MSLQVFKPLELFLAEATWSHLRFGSPSSHDRGVVNEGAYGGDNDVFSSPIDYIIRSTNHAKLKPGLPPLEVNIVFCCL